jgi:hypothetical protein
MFMRGLCLVRLVITYALCCGRCAVVSSFGCLVTAAAATLNLANDYLLFMELPTDLLMRIGC